MKSSRSSGRRSRPQALEGIDVSGPFPNDTLFHHALAGAYDAVVAMYHDQGHIALKTIGFERAVNVTLGLPIVRTSVAHGTAFDIAWKGLADPSSLIEAVRVAARIVAGSASATIERAERATCEHRRHLNHPTLDRERSRLQAAMTRRRRVPVMSTAAQLEWVQAGARDTPWQATGNPMKEDVMNTIDYIFRYDPRNQGAKPAPSDPAAARKALEDGNRMFSSWMESCRTCDMSEEGVEYVVPTKGLHLGAKGSQRETPKQAPFAVVMGCSDARVPTELLFGQGFNELFIVRVAGNVLGDVCLGSIDFRAARPDRQYEMSGGAGASRLRRRHGDGRLIPRAARSLDQGVVAGLALDHPADLCRSVRGRPRAAARLR